ncbi:MAG TPA: TonB-dependent receptor [Blastocatellia bacterium]|nr:TonB-dependent receptor [Blastocatellia bacterium]
MAGRTMYLGLLFSAAAPLAAQAQAVSPPPQSTGVAQAETLGEIVITAQRRVERLDQVPIAASVVSGAELTARGVSNLDDLGSLAPALNVQNQQALSYVNIRGVGLQTTNPTTSSGVANYSDGFFIPHETAIADAYYDVGQIEVLRGPQGTLVGQNSTGGAIFVNSARPSFDRITGFLQQSFGDYAYSQTQGAVNVPVSDHLAIRIAVNVSRKDSFYDDINAGGSALTAGLQPGDVASQSGRIGIKWQPTPDLDIYLKYESTTRNGDGYVGKSYAELGGSNNRIDPRLSNPFVVSYDVPSWDKYRLWRATDEINWNISESVTLRSLTGYQYTENRNQWDNDFTYAPISVANQQFRESTFEQEFNLISNGAGAFNWILGAFYLRDSTPTLLTLTVPPTIQIDTGPHERSYALFGQATYKFTDQWQLLMGGRANRDEKTSTGTERLVGFPFPPVSLDATVKTTEPTGKVALSYFPAPDSTVYVSASRGYKPGGANPSNSVNFIFQPEKINAYEGGYKGSFFGRQLRISSAGFYYDYKNMQTSVFDPVSQNAVVNVPSARIYGAELEADAQLGPVTLNTGFAYTESQINQQLALIDSRNPFAGPQDVTGRQLAYAPKWTANVGAVYTVPTRIGKVTATAQYSYTGGAYASVFEAVPIDVLGSHSLINLNLALTLENGLRVEAYGTNVGNIFYAAGTIGTGSAIWGAPRQYGGRLSYNF